MRIAINPIMINDIECSEAEVSVAISSSVAIRVVPVDAGGIEYPDAFMGVVGTTAEEDILTFFNSVSNAVSTLLGGRGI